MQHSKAITLQAQAELSSGLNCGPNSLVEIAPILGSDNMWSQHSLGAMLLTLGSYVINSFGIIPARVVVLGVCIILRQQYRQVPNTTNKNAMI